MLTHDYLVPSIRNWLSMKQQQTLAGRADLKLEQRARFWSVSRDKQQLPPLVEWLQIMLFSHRLKWNSTQQAMMREARRYYGSRIGTLALLTLAAVLSGGYLWNQVQQNQRMLSAQSAVQTMMAAPASELPAAVEQVVKLRQWTVHCYSRRSVTMRPHHQKSGAHF